MTVLTYFMRVAFYCTFCFWFIVFICSIMQCILFLTYAMLFTLQDDLQLVSGIGISILHASARLVAFCNEPSARRDGTLEAPIRDLKVQPSL
jgi:hypothetical protein